MVAFSIHTTKICVPCTILLLKPTVGFVPAGKKPKKLKNTRTYFN